MKKKLLHSLVRRMFVWSVCFTLVSTVTTDLLAGQPVRVSCVGDSITSGAGAPKGKSYPEQLRTLLGEGWLVGSFGRGGSTLLRKGDRPYWEQGSFQKAQDFKPDVVIIMLGTNDSKPNNWAFSGEFVSDYRDLIKVFQSLDSKPHIYLCPPPVVVEPNKYNISENVSAEIRKHVRDLAEETKLEIIPMDQAYGEDLSVLSDSVHPNEVGALKLAETVAKVLKPKP